MNKKELEDRIAAAITLDVRQAIEFAVETHGPLTGDHSRAMNILTEEVGEAAREILTMGRPRGLYEEPFLVRECACEELAQVAAVAIMMIANIKREMEDM